MTVSATKERRGESLDHLFMRSEMIPEVCVCVYTCDVRVRCIWIKTVCQWGRDLRLENMPRQTRWARCYFLTSQRFSFRFASVHRILRKVFPPFQTFFSFSFFGNSEASNPSISEDGKLK